MVLIQDQVFFLIHKVFKQKKQMRAVTLHIGMLQSDQLPAIYFDDSVTQHKISVNNLIPLLFDRTTLLLVKGCI